MSESDRFLENITIAFKKLFEDGEKLKLEVKKLKLEVENLKIQKKHKNSIPCNHLIEWKDGIGICRKCGEDF